LHGSGKWSDISKTHGNKTPKPSGTHSYEVGRSCGRIAHKVDAHFEATDHTSSPLSKSLLELLPQHANNTDSPIQTAIRESAADAEILYSFDSRGPSPSDRGRKVELGGLVEKAEKKWVAEQTERIVRGEYEVLDESGETTILNGRGKGKKSPKQRALKNQPAAVRGMDGDEDDGFELL
jgi:hypothetical protein